MCGSLDQSEYKSKRQLDWFSLFGTVRGCDTHTHVRAMRANTLTKATVWSAVMRLCRPGSRSALQGHDVAQSETPSVCDAHCINNKNNTNNNSNYNNTATFLWCCHYGQSRFESSPGSFDECKLSARWSPTLRPSQSCESAGSCWHPHHIAFCYYYYSASKLTFSLPSYGGWKAESI